MKVKSRSKLKKKVVKKQLSVTDSDASLINAVVPKKISKSVSHKKKYFILGAVTIILICLGWFLSQTWIIRSAFSQYVTYPQVSVLGINIGSLDAGQLDGQLAAMKTDFELKKVTLNNDKKQWIFDAKKLGVNFDAQATGQSVWKLNNLNFIDKYKLLTGSISSKIIPTITVDNTTCIKSLSVIPVVQIEPVDAYVYFDQTVKIKPDQSGNKFSAVKTCQELPKIIGDNLFITDVALDVTSANVTKTDLEPKLSTIQSMVGKAVSVKASNYQQTLDSKQLLSLLDIVKKGTEIQVSWSSSRLDDLVNGIADKINTYNGSPALGGCQYLVSSGGNWLDKTSAKKIFTDLGADSSRDYTLPVNYYAPVISTINPVAYGSSGTIFLTFDDGMTYADQIMNYASCYGVKVTFFEIGQRAGSDAVQLKRAIAEGHAVQSHGYEHAMYDYGDRSYDWQNNDISQSISTIMGITGVRPTYFRPPGGNRSDNTYKAAAANGVNLILWNDASRDATVGGLSSATTCANVLAGAYPGASVLMHSTHQSTANAVPCIIEGLAARGYNMQALR